MIKVGHRGAAGLAPENTLKSFAKALELGVDMVECDVRLTKDRQLVVFHDRKLQRITGYKGRISRLTLQQLKQLNAGDGEKIPTLTEVLMMLKGRCAVNLEIKDSRAIKYLVSEISKCDFPCDQLTVSSNYQRVLKRINKKNPDVTVAWLFRSNDNIIKQFIWVALMMIFYPLVKWHILRIMNFNNIKVINIQHLLASKSLIDKIHQYNKMIFAWTVDGPMEIAKLKKWGIDGIISNYPNRL